MSALPSCAGPASTLQPETPEAATIADLWWAMLAGSVLLYLLVALLLAAAFLRRQPARPRARLWLVGGGLVLPALTLTPLLVFGVAAGERLLPHPATAVPVIEVHARMWAWRFVYRDGQGTARQSEGVLHVPAGRAVDLRITSHDVIHSFWVPRLAGKLDAIPGRVNTLRLRAPRPGEFIGPCAEFCGIGHWSMYVTVRVHPLDAYARAIEALAPAAASDPLPAPRERRR
jgi:cytochrome c oxidase subunit 2